MKTVKIADLKNRLSYYLRFVRRGQSVLVYDRDRAIARIDPVSSADALDPADWTAELERTGVLRPPAAPLPRDWLKRRIHAKGNGDVVGALLEERESGR
jgi:antitoxin (DNA-binding transcriptional repressor) of toxin-antitoxin stability system